MATQRLSSAPARSAADAVRALLAVQSQDAPLAAWSLGLRSRHRTYADVRAAQDTSAFVRTHVLRPTWHFVAAEDLRWLLDLTSGKVISSMAARHRALELDEHTIGRSLDAVVMMLSTRGPLTRKQIGPLLEVDGLPGPGPRLAHVLLLAELRGLVCSGPHAGREHTYTVLDDALPPDPDPPADRDEALGRLVTRFFAGHGPAGVGDLVRWAAVTKGDVERGLAVAGDALAAVEVSGETQWFDPADPPRSTGSARGGAYLLPTFDEAVLSYVRTPFARPVDHVRGTRRLSPAEAGGGTVLLAGRDVGIWRRVVSPRHVTVRVDLAESSSPAGREAVRVAARRLADFVELPLRLDELSRPG